MLWLRQQAVVKISKSGQTVKRYNSINDNGYINALIEISAGSLEKWEYNKETKQVEIELVNDNPRIINYLGYPTWYDSRNFALHK